MKLFLCTLYFLLWSTAWGHLRTTLQRTTENENKAEPQQRLLAPYKGAEDLLSAYQFAKARLLQNVERDYGVDWYSSIFEDDEAYESMTGVGVNETRTTKTTSSTIGRHAFLQTDHAVEAWNRIKRKFMMRILKYQLTGEQTPFVWATA